MNIIRRLMEKPGSIYILCFVYAIHMVEEFALGFVEWANRYFGVFNWTQNLIGNTVYMTLLVLACFFYKKNPVKNLWIGMTGPMWVLANVFIHLSATILGKEYSPGVVTAVLLYIPVGVAFLIMWGKKGVLNAKNITLSFLVGGLLIMILPTFVRSILVNAELAKLFHFI